MPADPDEVLAALWAEGNPTAIPDEDAPIPEDIRQSITDSINSRTKTYRYVLPNQLLAKLTDPEIDCRVVQGGASMPGSFDARSFCSRHIVPFDRAHHDVLGGSADPYVNNPLRIPVINDHYAAAQRDQVGFRKLQLVLNHAEAHPPRIENLLRLVLQAIADRLSQTKVVYPTPNRVSLQVADQMITHFLETRTGGRRLQAVASALFDTMGQRFHFYERVYAGHINRADAASGDVADLDCVDMDGETVLNVEVKDRRLRVHEVQNTLRAARERGIAEILYLIRGGVEPTDAEAYQRIKKQQFVAGHNIYEIEFEALLHPCLILFGEAGRRQLLEAVGHRLDEFGELSDRQAWRDILDQV